jgi:hypothetical protein
MIGKHLLFAISLFLFLALPPLGLAESSDKMPDQAVSGTEPARLSVSADKKPKDTSAVPDKNAKIPKPTASPDPTSCGEPTPAPSPTGDASPSASPDPEMQAAAAKKSAAATARFGRTGRCKRPQSLVLAGPPASPLTPEIWSQAPTGEASASSVSIHRPRTPVLAARMSRALPRCV